MGHYDISEEDVQEDLLQAVIQNNQKDIIKIFKYAKKKNINLDLTYNDGLLCELIAQNGSLEVLKLMCDYNKEIISHYGAKMLSNAINHQKVDCVKFLLRKGIDLLELKNTTSYDYYQDIRELVENSPNLHEDQDSVYTVGNSESSHNIDFHLSIFSH